MKRALRKLARQLGVDPYQLAAGIERIMADAPTCTCGKPGTHPFLALPDEPWRYSAAAPAPGKVRVILGVACAEHAVADFVVRQVRGAERAPTVDGRALVDRYRGGGS